MPQYLYDIYNVVFLVTLILFAVGMPFLLMAQTDAPRLVGYSLTISFVEVCAVGLTYFLAKGSAYLAFNAEFWVSVAIAVCIAVVVANGALVYYWKQVESQRATHTGLSHYQSPYGQQPSPYGQQLGQPMMGQQQQQPILQWRQNPVQRPQPAPVRTPFGGFQQTPPPPPPSMPPYAVETAMPTYGAAPNPYGTGSNPYVNQQQGQQQTMPPPNMATPAGFSPPPAPRQQQPYPMPQPQY